MSATGAASVPSSPQEKRTAWPFAAMIVSAALLGIGLAVCVRTMLPVWTLDGSGASFFTNIVCSSRNSSASPQAARPGD
jgi:hypothetical protein